jgi:hypothetical protein
MNAGRGAIRKGTTCKAPFLFDALLLPVTAADRSRSR